MSANQMENSELEYVMALGDKMHEYEKEWVAIIDKKVIARGRTAKEVFRKAKEKHPNKIPLVIKIPSEDVMLL